MGTLALLDILTPYGFGGASFGEPLHEFLSAIFVQDVVTTFDDGGIVVSGTARFSADANIRRPKFTPPASIDFHGSVTVDHRTTRHDGAFWDFPDIAMPFRLTAPRVSSPVADLVVSGGPGNNPPALNDANVKGVLTSLQQGAGDGPDTLFRLEILFEAGSLHLPYLQPAKLLPDGTLAPDDSFPDVSVSLPKLKFTIQQTAGTVSGGSVNDPQVSIALDSWGAEGIDDPAGSAYAELLQMQPPFAFFGPGDTCGFGFQSLILDMSGTATPPDILTKFGVGDDFRGLYFPDVRFFIKTSLLNGLKIDVSARELLIGWGPEGGVSGIFGLDLVNPTKAQSAVVTIYDPMGHVVQRIEIPAAPDPPAPVPAFSQDVNVPADTFWTVDVNGGQPPYNVTVDGQVATGKAVEIQFPPGANTKTVAVHIEDVHAGGQSRDATFHLSLTAPSLTSGQPVSPDQPAAPTVSTAAPPGYSITMLDSPHQETVTLVFTPSDPSTATLTSGGSSSALTINGGRATVPLAHGANIDVSATWTVPAIPPGTKQTLEMYFKYDQPNTSEAPSETDPETGSWAGVNPNPPPPVLPVNDIHASPSRDESQPANDWTIEGDDLVKSSGFQSWVALSTNPPVATVHLAGSASAESRPNPDYNVHLSQRRIWAAEALLRASGVTQFDTPVAQGEVGPSGVGRGANRKVEASFTPAGTPATTANGGVHILRPPRPPVPPPPTFQRTVPEAAGTPDIQFKEAHARVEIDHNRLIAIELKLKVDVKTALESYLSTVKQNNAGSLPAAGQGSTSLPVGKQADPNDGVIDMRVQLTLDDTVGRWQIVASLFEQDKDGFLQTPPPTAMGPGSDAEQFWRTFFGVLVALAPLLDDLASANTTPGDLAALTIGVGVPLAAAKLGLVVVPRITCYGGELTITHDPAGTRGAILLDIEVALIVVLDIGGTKLIDTDPDHPITVRYKAVGFKTSDHPKLGDFIPVFDSSKGYTINVPSGGGIHVPDPLGNILQVMGTRVARSNPVNLELDLALKADLGVVSVDRTTIRIPLDGGSAPTISALGVHVDVPGAVEGSGYLAIYPDGFAGQLDVSLAGLGLRIAAGLSVRHIVDPNDPNHQATAVLLTLEVDFPVPIALGSSGLGIYGFAGLFALYFERKENPNSPTPALDWFSNVVHGNPLDITGWTPAFDHWAIGLGAVLGTMDDGFMLNVKGMIIFELPGPRILLVMKAKIIQPRPPREGDVTATILAVIDIDLGRNIISIGLTFDYAIDPLLSIHIPIRAIFPFDDLTNFAIDAGEWYNAATVTFFKVFTARGYFVIRGRDIPNATYDAGQPAPPLGPVYGFSVAVGVLVSFVWGDEGSGLYLKVGASADFALGFSPILFKGQLRVWGELHLWIVGIEASAQLSLTAGAVPDGPPLPDGTQPTKTLVLIDGEVHGKIDLFFFSLEGSVHVTLGSDPGPGPAIPPDLVSGVSLHSRSAALLRGSGLDRPIDGKLTDAQKAGPFPEGQWVPIDAIPVIHFDCVPRVPGTSNFQTTAGGNPVSVPVGPPSGSASPAVRRGANFYTYRINGISLSAPLTAGDVPIVWWTPNPGTDIMSPETKVQLALLSRVPSAYPSAVERSVHLTSEITQKWSNICSQVAPPTSVLWTFIGQPRGSSTVGWTLTGSPWPDPPGSTRSVPPNTQLHVAETWRTGNITTDLLKPVTPARVLGALVECPRQCGGFIDRSARVSGVSRLDELSDLVDLTLLTNNNVASALANDRQAGSPAAESQLVATRQQSLRADGDLVTNLGLANSDFVCVAQVLEAPFRRMVKVQALAEPVSGILTQVYVAMFQEPAGQPPRLDDVVAYWCGQVTHVRLLLLVPSTLLASGLFRLRCFDEKGKLLDEITINGVGASRTVNVANDLPPTWRDPKGPWACEVQDVLSFFAASLSGARRPWGHIVLIDTDLPAGTTYFHTGVASVEQLLGKQFTRPSYLVGVVETLSAAEVARQSVDQAIAKNKIDTINGALKGLQQPPALLTPKTQYTVHIDWAWAVCDKDGNISNESDPATWKASSQDFLFSTDDIPLKPRSVSSQTGDGQPQVGLTMPVRLDPWVLVTNPDEDTKFFFYGQHLRVVLAVDYLLDMYLAYGVKLEAQVRAASYRNSSPQSPNHSKTVKAITPALQQPLKNAVVYTPWEDTTRQVLANAPCINSAGDVSRQVTLDLDLLLEPSTDYILDIQPQNAPAPPPNTTATPLFRRKFITSRYANVMAMCADVAATDVRQQPAAAADIAGLISLASAPGPLSGSALDAALKKAGLEPVTQVKSVVADLLWVADVGGLQPQVLVLRTPEPLIRNRNTPTDYEPPGQPRLGRKVTRLAPAPYLEVVATVGNANAPVYQMIGAPDLGVIVFVITSGRGKTLDLSLRSHGDLFLDGSSTTTDTELLKMNFDSAPWEKS